MLSTKVGARPLPGHADLGHVAGLSARAIREQVLASLERLRTDHIDVLLRPRAPEVGMDAGQLGLAWMGQRATPVIPIVGTSRREQVRSARQALTTDLPDGLLTTLSDARG